MIVLVEALALVLASWPSSTSTSVFEFKNVTLDDDDDIIEDDDGSDKLAVVPKLAVYIV